MIAGRLPGPGAYGFADYKNKAPVMDAKPHPSCLLATAFVCFVWTFVSVKANLRTSFQTPSLLVQIDKSPTW